MSPVRGMRSSVVLWNSWFHGPGFGPNEFLVLRREWSFTMLVVDDARAGNLVYGVDHGAGKDDATWILCQPVLCFIVQVVPPLADRLLDHDGPLLLVKGGAPELLVAKDSDVFTLGSAARTRRAQAKNRPESVTQATGQRYVWMGGRSSRQS